MPTHPPERQTVHGDDDRGDTATRPTASADHDAPDRPVSARVVVIAAGDGQAARYASWLADTYETQVVRRGETMPNRPGTEAVVVDRRTLAIAGERASGNVGLGRAGCRVLAPAALGSCGGLVDEYIAEPVGRDGLLQRVETAMRVATYRNSIAELLSLTVRRRRLRERSNGGRVDDGPAIASLSRRIDELHRRIDDTLSDVESRYAGLLGRRHRRPTRHNPETESA